jgi:hypothetical protein
MAKLTRYTNFEALKAEVKSRKAAQVKNKKLSSEFEAFLHLLQSEYAHKKKTKTSYGK